VTAANDKERWAFYGLRHFAPKVVRLIRLALDNGSTELELRALCKGEHAEYQRDAIRFMAEHPWAGRCKNFDGDESWSWEEAPA
jgi:hypothetical protein